MTGRSHGAQGFEFVRFIVVENVNRRIDLAADRDGLDRGKWLQHALHTALARSEGGSQ